jgi:hypothetical protein
LGDDPSDPDDWSRGAYTRVVDQRHAVAVQIVPEGVGDPDIREREAIDFPTEPRGVVALELELVSPDLERLSVDGSVDDFGLEFRRAVRTDDFYGSEHFGSTSSLEVDDFRYPDSRRLTFDSIMRWVGSTSLVDDLSYLTDFRGVGGSSNMRSLEEVKHIREPTD